MKAATVKELKTELSNHTQEDLIKICLRLSRFKKENKELLTYLLYEAENEHNYIESVKREIDTQFEEVNTKTYYFIKKSIRKILRIAKKYIRYSQNKETEVEILLYFCQKLKEFKPSINHNKVLKGIFLRQIERIQTLTKKMHEDLQYDYEHRVTSLL
jgi:uracil phosphoribosyltransferase